MDAPGSSLQSLSNTITLKLSLTVMESGCRRRSWGYSLGGRTSKAAKLANAVRVPEKRGQWYVMRRALTKLGRGRQIQRLMTTARSEEAVCMGTGHMAGWRRQSVLHRWRVGTPSTPVNVVDLLRSVYGIVQPIGDLAKEEQVSVEVVLNHCLHS